MRKKLTGKRVKKMPVARTPLELSLITLKNRSDTVADSVDRVLRIATPSTRNLFRHARRAKFN